MISFSKEKIEGIARAFQAHKKIMDSKHNAWMATLNQYTDLKSLSSDDRRYLLFDVEKFIKDQERIEKAASEGIIKEKSPDNIRQVTEIEIIQPKITKEAWGIGRGLPSEDDNVIIHEPDMHSESLIDDETIKYVSRTAIRKELKKEYKEEIEKRTGLKMR